MANFELLLLDADDTLLDYPADASAALAAALGQIGREWSPAVEETYQRYNQAAWRRFELGELTKPQLQIVRFEQFFAELGIQSDPAEFNRSYMSRLAEGGRLLPGARELCQALFPSTVLCIVTNGVEQTQRGRFRRSGLLPYLQGLYISDAVGYQKPRREFFEFVLEDLHRRRGPFDRDRVLVCGDSLSSDMQGGVNAGLHTCWYNPARKEPNGLSIDYVVSNYDEIIQIVLG